MIKLRKLLAAVMAFTIILVCAACGENKVDHEHLKTDIIGIWCDINGPEYNEESDCYYIYEFTDTNIIYHTPQQGISIYNEQGYEIRENILDVEGAMCRISIENDVLTMSFNDGASQYRRMTVEEVTKYGVICIGDELYEKQKPLIIGSAEQTTAASE